jgi:exodeoxyribonuclease VII large subunit
VADLRAPTPSAAAELAVPDLSDYSAAILNLADRLTELVKSDIAQRREVLRVRAQWLSLLSPRRAIDADLQRIDGLIDRLDRAMRQNLDRQMSRLAISKASLSAVNPMATLARGFAIVRDADGRLIRSIHEARTDERITVQVSDGTFGAQISE